jgi:hypothetical protein
VVRSSLFLIRTAPGVGISQEVTGELNTTKDVMVLSKDKLSELFF